MNNGSDIVVGAGAVVAGGGGATLQLVTQYANLTLLFINIVIALGGLYLLWFRIRKAHKDEGTQND